MNFCCFLVHGCHCINWVGRSWGDTSLFQHSLEFSFIRSYQGVRMKPRKNSGDGTQLPVSSPLKYFDLLENGFEESQQNGHLISHHFHPFTRRMQIRMWWNVWIQRKLMKMSFSFLSKQSHPPSWVGLWRVTVVYLYVCVCMCQSNWYITNTTQVKSIC